MVCEHDDGGAGTRAGVGGYDDGGAGWLKEKKMVCEQLYNKMVQLEQLSAGYDDGDTGAGDHDGSAGVHGGDEVHDGSAGGHGGDEVPARGFTGTRATEVTRWIMRWIMKDEEEDEKDEDEEDGKERREG